MSNGIVLPRHRKILDKVKSEVGIKDGRRHDFEHLLDPTEEMITAGLSVDLSNEDERSAVINLWHAMVSQAIRQHSQKGRDTE